MMIFCEKWFLFKVYTEAMNSICYLITGKLTLELVARLQVSFQHVPNKVISVWVDEDLRFLDYLHQHGFQIVMNFPPQVKSSANLQAACIVNGLHKIIGMGFEKCIRVRTDMFFENIEHATNVIAGQIREKLVCLSGMSSESPKLWYYLDLLIAGRCETMLKFFSPLMKKDESRCAEMFWLETYLGRKCTTKEDVLEVFEFCGQHLYGQPVLCHWIDKGWELFQHYIRPGNYFIWYA